MNFSQFQDGFLTDGARFDLLKWHHLLDNEQTTKPETTMNTKPTLTKSHTDSVLNSLLVATFLGLVALSAMPSVTSIIA